MADPFYLAVLRLPHSRGRCSHTDPLESTREEEIEQGENEEEEKQNRYHLASLAAHIAQILR